MNLCVVDGCLNERWTGPNGSNPRLTRCEQHQREYWREKKAASNHSGRRADRSHCCVEGCPNPRHVQPSGKVLSYCLEHNNERQAEYNRRYLAKRAEVAAPAARTSIRVSKKVGKPPTRQPVKVLLLNRQSRQMVHIEGQIVLDTPLPADPLEAELLLETYEDYIVVEQGDKPQAQVVTARVQDLIAKIRIWQTAAARYDEACEEARQINDGKHYPSSPGRRAAIKALDAHAMELIHDVHNEAVLEMLVTLADEIERLQVALEPFVSLFSEMIDQHEYVRNNHPLYVLNDLRITVEDVNRARGAGR